MKPVLRANLFAMIVVILMAFGSMIVAIAMNILQLPAEYSVIVTEVLFLVIPAIIFLISAKLPVKITLKLNALNFPAIMISLLIGILLYPMSLFLGTLAQLFFHNYLQDAVITMQSMPLWAFIVTIAVTPAICEELAMRGVVFSGYGKINMKKAALMNGFLFGILHMNFQQFFYAFLIGVILTYMVDATKSLYSSMIAHFACNGVSALITYFALKVIANNPGGEIENITSLPTAAIIISLIVQFIIFVVCLTAIIFLIKLLYSITRNRMKDVLVYVDSDRISGIEAVEPVEDLVKERVFNWPVYVTVVIFAIFIVLLEISNRLTV